MLINQMDLNAKFDNCLSMYHLPIGVPNDSCFTSVDACRIVEALQHALMVLLHYHHIDKASNQNGFPLQYSLCDLNVLIENSFSHEPQGFEYQDPNAE